MPTRRTCLTGLAALTLAPWPAWAQDADAAVAATTRLLTDAHAALAQGGGDTALLAAINDAFAFDIWEAFLLQQQQDTFSAAERAEVRRLLPGFLAQLYRDRFDKGLSTAPQVGTARKVRNDFLVSSMFPRVSGDNLPVNWRLRAFSGEMRVIDVMVGGTSFLLLKRDEFSSLIAQGGPGALIQHMRDNAL